MEQSNSKIIPVHSPDEKPSVISIFKKVCELAATPVLFLVSRYEHKCRKAWGEETTPALVSCPVFDTSLFLLSS